MNREKIPGDHPALAGHFPGQPLVPGVVILDKVIEAASQRGYRINGIASAKFSAPLGPEQPFQIEIESDSRGLAFAVRCDDTLFASGRFSLEKDE